MLYKGILRLFKKLSLLIYTNSFPNIESMLESLKIDGGVSLRDM